MASGERRWQAPDQLNPLIHPASAGLEKYRPQISYLLLDEGRFSSNELNSCIITCKSPSGAFTELKDLQEVQTMLAEHVKKWTQEWEEQGIAKGRQEGMEKGLQAEAVRLLLLLLESKFGAVSSELQE